MTTPTTYLGWLKPDPTDKVNINVINTIYDEFDADARSYYLSKLPIVPTMGKFRFTGLEYACNNSVNLLNATSTSSYLWKTLWKVESNVDVNLAAAGGAFSFTNGNILFTKTGVYRIGYNIVMAATGTTAAGFEGWAKAGLYRRSTSTLVAGSEVVERRVFNASGFFQHLHKSFLVYVDGGASGLLTFNDYSLGISCSSSAGASSTITTVMASATPYETTCTVEYVRSL